MTSNNRHTTTAAQIVYCLEFGSQNKPDLTISLGMSKFQTRTESKGRGHQAVAEASISVSRVAGVALPVPGLGVRLGLGLPLVVTRGEGAVGVGGVAPVTTHCLIHCPAHWGGGGLTLLCVGHVTLLKCNSDFI